MASISASNLNSGIEGLLAQGKWREIHEVLVMHLACMLLVIAGHRPVDALFKLLLGDIYLDGQGGLALFRDKVHDAAHDPRIAVLAPCLVKQIQAYLLHIQGPVSYTHLDVYKRQAWKRALTVRSRARPTLSTAVFMLS